MTRQRTKLNSCNKGTNRSSVRLGSRKAVSLFRRFTNARWQGFGETAEFLVSKSRPLSNEWPEPVGALDLDVAKLFARQLTKLNRLCSNGNNGRRSNLWQNFIFCSPIFPLAFGPKAFLVDEWSSHGETCPTWCTGDTILQRLVGRDYRAHHKTRSHSVKKLRWSPKAVEITTINRQMSLRRRKFDVHCGIVARIGRKGSGFLFELSQMKVAGSELTDKSTVW